MNAKIWLPGILALSALIAAPAMAQSASTWEELLASRTRVAYRYTHPPATGTCGATQLPDRGQLRVPAAGTTIGRTWLPGPNHSRWEALTGPTGGAPLEVNVVELWCGPTGESLLVETDGYYIEIFATALAGVDAAGALTPGIFAAYDGSGALQEVTLREECVGGICQRLLADATQIAAETVVSLAQAREAELRQFEEATRRAEDERTARLEASSAIRAQAQAVSRRQQVETLQRYGATEEQAAAILQRRVLVGMTPAMVRAALGDPARQESTSEGGSTIETWTYPGRQIIIVDNRVAEIR